MDKSEQEFLKRLLATFQTEAGEHLRALSAGLFELEKTAEPDAQLQIVERIFREAHSLKGAARSVDLRDVESLCQPLESGMAALKRGQIHPSPALLDLFHEAVDLLTHLVANSDSPRDSADRTRLRDMQRRLDQAAQVDDPTAFPAGSSTAAPRSAPVLVPSGHELLPAAPPIDADGSLSPPATAQTEPATQTDNTAADNTAAKNTVADNTADDSTDGDSATIEDEHEYAPQARYVPDVLLAETVRIPLRKLDPLLLQAEEMIQAKLAITQRAVDLHKLEQTLLRWRADWAVWKTQQGGVNLALPVWFEDQLDVLAGQIEDASRHLDQDRRVLSNMVDEHLDAMRQTLLLPASTLLEPFPRLVRDLARDQGKEVHLEIHGAEIEVDKRILEELKDPLVHLVRNCVDHGIERPPVRVERQKPTQGLLTLAFRIVESRFVEIDLADDGEGVPVDRVRAAAVRAGLLSEAAAAAQKPDEILPLIFQSGLSTSQILTDLSGRGLGMAIVREKVEQLGGTVSVESAPGQGTAFHLRLPLSRATLRGVRVVARGHQVVLPTAQVERVLRLHAKTIQTVENRETIQWDGQVLAIVSLGAILGLPSRPQDAPGISDPGLASGASDYVSVLVLGLGERRIAVQVEEILAEEEVLLKGLGQQLLRVRNIAGATVLGTGQVVPILNVADLIVSATHPGVVADTGIRPEPDTAPPRHILVAEDSITSRSLIMNILESGGYVVTTAVDGMDAFAKLGKGGFDLVVSDVDMPRMSGFELTKKIRDDQLLGQLPVILVTALGSRQDQERGVEVGASAYIIKSSFDQSNLLDVVRRLL